MTDAMTNHSDSESLAAFVDGRLGREEREAVTQHLQTCEECQGFVREAAAFEQEEEAVAKKPGRTWWAVAAAVVVVLAVAPFVPGFLHRRELAKGTQQLFAAIADSKERVIEARFGGQHSYAKLKPTMRHGGGDEKSIEEMLVEGKASELAFDSTDDTSPAGRRAAALAEVFNGDQRKSLDNKSKSALEILNGIPNEARNAVIWNDIAALNYRLNNFSDALVAVEEAIRLDPKMAEAMFNRVLILHKLGKADDATKALNSYLAADPDSEWAAEAQKKLSEPTPLQ